MRLPGMGSHESTRAESDEWLTPPHIVRALGEFDLDPCSPVDRTWDTAKNHLTREDDGLDAAWFGRVWLNPPYSEVERWIARLALYGRGTALVFARVETGWWFDHIWPKASAVLFPRTRIRFMRADGTTPTAGSGAPSALVAYGARDADWLASSGIAGAYVTAPRVQEGRLV
jgi:hypothetical protein